MLIDIICTRSTIDHICAAVLQKLCRPAPMISAYVFEIEDEAGGGPAASAGMLSRRASILTIFGLALAAWLPLLVPLLVLLHR